MGSLYGTRTGLLGGICLSPSLPGSTSLPGVVGEGKARAFRGEPLLEWYKEAEGSPANWGATGQSQEGQEAFVRQAPGPEFRMRTDVI